MHPSLICTIVSFLTLSDHVSANSDSAEDIAEDSDAAVDEEEDDEEVLVKEDQIQTSVCTIHGTIKPQLFTCRRWSYSILSCCVPPQEGDDEDSDEATDKLLTSHPDADTTIIFMTGEGWFAPLSGFSAMFSLTGEFVEGKKLKWSTEYNTPASFWFMGWQLCVFDCTT